MRVAQGPGKTGTSARSHRRGRIDDNGATTLLNDGRLRPWVLQLVRGLNAEQGQPKDQHLGGELGKHQTGSVACTGGDSTSRVSFV